MKPSVGRIVHYQTADGIYAALIVAVREDGTVNLVVWGRHGGMDVRFGVIEGTDPNTWYWPPRV